MARPREEHVSSDLHPTSVTRATNGSASHSSRGRRRPAGRRSRSERNGGRVRPGHRGGPLAQRTGFAALRDRRRIGRRRSFGESARADGGRAGRRRRTRNVDHTRCAASGLGSAGAGRHQRIRRPGSGGRRCGGAEVVGPSRLFRRGRTAVPSWSPRPRETPAESSGSTWRTGLSHPIDDAADHIDPAESAREPAPLRNTGGILGADVLDYGTSGDLRVELVRTAATASGQTLLLRGVDQRAGAQRWEIVLDQAATRRGPPRLRP